MPVATRSSAVAPSTSSDFPQELVGRKILLATESLGPVNGVSRTTQSLVDYLRANGVHVATCAPYYKGQHINASEPVKERKPIVNKDWVRSIEAKSSALGSRAIGGAWQWHFDRDEQQPQLQQQQQQQQQATQTSASLQASPTAGPRRRTPMLASHRGDDSHRAVDAASNNPDFRLQGFPLPYNPDLTVAYPFRLGRVYSQTFKPDIIYLASPASVGFQFLVQLDQLSNPPPVLLNFQTDLSAYAAILFAPPLDRYAVFLLQRVQGYLFRARAVRTIFYPSAYVRRYMEDAGAPSDKMLQLGRGVDTALFNPSRRDDAYRAEIAPNGEFIFCCISRLAPEKGFEFLAAAARRLRDSGLPFKLLIVGGNKNPAVDGEVRGYFSDLGERVIFTGMLRGAALARAYAAADAFLHCSITETFGLVVLEAMASGVPVVARDEGGPSETVRHDISGFLVPPHDLDGFVARARALATDPPLLARMAVAARAQALDTTWDRINLQVARKLVEALPRDGEGNPGSRVEDYYGSWIDMARVYFAVGIVWVFWLIAVVPMLMCGFVHGLFK